MPTAAASSAADSPVFNGSTGRSAEPPRQARSDDRDADDRSSARALITMTDAHPLADGCYFLAYGNEVDVWYEGTLRVERRDGDTFASGDLYAVKAGTTDDPPVGFVPPRGQGIPIFPIADYTYYLRVTRIAPVENGFDLTFEARRFFPRVTRQLDGAMAMRWALEGSYTARMMPAKAPAGYPKADRFFVGDVSDPTNPLPPFRMQLGWVSPFLRAAV